MCNLYLKVKRVNHHTRSVAKGVATNMNQTLEHLWNTIIKHKSSNDRKKNCKNTCIRITSAQAVNFVSRTLNDIKIYIVELVGIERFCFELVSKVL